MILLDRYILVVILRCTSVLSPSSSLVFLHVIRVRCRSVFVIARDVLGSTNVTRRAKLVVEGGPQPDV
jgi:hypothetical protein